MSFKYRQYQSEIIVQASEVLKGSNFVYLTMEVRTGKTLTALGTVEMHSRLRTEAQRVLFVSRKKALSSILSDYDMMDGDFNICAVNYESLHKVEKVKWDYVIIDEAHGIGSYPKPNKRQKQLSAIIKRDNPKVILLSGTPSPESFSQLYHQVSMIKGNPFSQFVNFYKFAAQYVAVTQKRIGSMLVKDYSAGSDLILAALKPFMLSYTQKEAGYKGSVQEFFLTCKAKPITAKLINQLKKDRVIEGKEETILADTPVKLLSKVHQLSGGTIKFDSGARKVIDDSKAQFIKKHFAGKKIAIFYKFKAELDALVQVYGDSLTTDLDEFNSTKKHIALQIISGREGISLKEADCLVMYNVDFSATSYWQSRDRLTTKDREVNEVYWIFSDVGIEQEVYNAVSKKKDYTLAHFKQNNLPSGKQSKLF
jgi:hypothetical protein